MEDDTDSPDSAMDSPDSATDSSEPATTKHAQADDYTTSRGTALAVAVLVALVTFGYVLLIRTVQQSQTLGRLLPVLSNTVLRSIAWLGAYAVVVALASRYVPRVDEFDRRPERFTVGRLLLVAVGSAVVIGVTLELTAGAITFPVYFWFGGGSVVAVAWATFRVLERAPDLDKWVSKAETLGGGLVVGGVLLAIMWWGTTASDWGTYVWLVRWVYTPIVFASFGVYYLVAFADASQRADGDGVVTLTVAALVALVESCQGPLDFFSLSDAEDETASETDDAETAA